VLKDKIIFIGILHTSRGNDAYMDLRTAIYE